MFRVELGKALRRWRTWALAALAAALPVLVVIGLVLGGAPAPGEGPPFLAQILRSGFFTPLASLAILQPFFLPLATGLLSGDAVAGEASAGTLRYLLVRPVGRLRLVTVKYAFAVALLGAGVAWTMLVAVAAGGLAFGWDPLPSLSGSTLSAASTILRLFAAGGYVLAEMAGLAAVGLFISTLTDSGPGAIAATVAFWIASGILGVIPSLEPIRPYLLTADALAFADLFRSPIAWDAIRHGLTVYATYAVIFLSAALLVFWRKDVIS